MNKYIIALLMPIMLLQCSFLQGATTEAADLEEKVDVLTAIYNNPEKDVSARLKAMVMVREILQGNPGSPLLITFTDDLKTIYSHEENNELLRKTARLLESLILGSSLDLTVVSRVLGDLSLIYSNREEDPSTQDNAVEVAGRIILGCPGAGVLPQASEVFEAVFPSSKIHSRLKSLRDVIQHMKKFRERRRVAKSKAEAVRDAVTILKKNPGLQIAQEIVEELRPVYKDENSGPVLKACAIEAVSGILESNPSTKVSFEVLEDFLCILHPDHGVFFAIDRILSNPENRDVEKAYILLEKIRSRRIGDSAYSKVPVLFIPIVSILKHHPGLQIAQEIVNDLRAVYKDTSIRGELQMYVIKAVGDILHAKESELAREVVDELCAHREHLLENSIDHALYKIISGRNALFSVRCFDILLCSSHFSYDQKQYLQSVRDRIDFERILSNAGEPPAPVAIADADSDSSEKTRTVALARLLHHVNTAGRTLGREVGKFL